MALTKRNFLKLGAAAATVPMINSAFSTPNVAPTQTQLTDITKGATPISLKERELRLKKAQQLMKQHKVAALILEPGAAMDYFSGIQWWRSERVTALVIPQEGEISVVCPFFEEPSIRETLKLSNDVRVWQEHESPFLLVKNILKERGITKGNLAFEHSVRYFVLKGIMSELPNMVDVPAEAVTRGCRMFKSHNELLLMHKANEVTLTAYSTVYQSLAIGMTGSDVQALMDKTQRALGGKGTWNMALINEASAYPHGTHQVQTIREGSIVLMDCGCSVHGYQSDISRTFVFGEPTKKQQDIWKTVRKGQDIAFETAQIGVPAGKVDDAVRAYYQTLGFGPDYKLPGLSHRTGHGIGMKGHEAINFVRGEKTALAAGMCFSNEPGIYIPKSFGVRLEDCLYMTPQGPQWFTHPPKSLAEPIGKLAAKPQL